jgi:hypothetical protein
MNMNTLEHLLLFFGVMLATWILFTYLWPRMLLFVYKRAILGKGAGDGPIPINTLYTEPQAVFADPLHTLASAPRVMTSGVNRDTLMTLGWLDLRKDPLVLHVPDMNDRYYSVQFTNPSNNTNFAYVGKRATGTQAGDYLITGPGWKGQVSGRLKQISSPNNSVLVIGRVFVENNDDLASAYDLSKQIQLTPLKP